LPSSGLHSNGFSLVRKILFKDHDIQDKMIISQVLEPTKIYVKPILNLISKVNIKGIAHITGGGFDENIPRILPNDCGATIDTNAFSRPEIYNTLKRLSGMNDREMFQVFNMGIGMMVVIDSKDIQETLDLLKESGEEASVIGSITNQKGLTFLW
ncbi:MAG: AIR synthase-related protein, partial [Acholeplasmataceae bacterium]|nr:AIR synthase-related protein [Acholeplasmataceae bacterium]